MARQDIEPGRLLAHKRRPHVPERSSEPEPKQPKDSSVEPQSTNCTQLKAGLIWDSDAKE